MGGWHGHSDETAKCLAYVPPDPTSGAASPKQLISPTEAAPWANRYASRAAQTDTCLFQAVVRERGVGEKRAPCTASDEWLTCEGVRPCSYNDHGPVYTWKKPVLPEDQPKPVVVSHAQPLRRTPSEGNELVTIATDVATGGWYWGYACIAGTTARAWT